MKTLIFSNDRDFSTTHVIDWLQFKHREFIRINYINYANTQVTININQFKEKSYIRISDQLMNSGDSLWIRKYPRTSHFDYLERISDIPTKQFMKDEMDSFIISVISFHNKHFRALGTNSQYNTPMSVNKIEVLMQANNAGFKIPNTIITNSKMDIEKFYYENPKCIIKPISDPYIASNEKHTFKMLTKYFSKRNLANLNTTFFPILMQEYIPKKFELRVFFLGGKIYSGAIFSQNDKKTKIDYRNYNDERPNRIVPFVLPNEIKVKLNHFMALVGLNTGSIDIIYSDQGEYYFLEVNPVGQFGNVSYSCNFYLEEIIAEYLANEI